MCPHWSGFMEFQEVKSKRWRAGGEADDGLSPFTGISFSSGWDGKPLENFEQRGDLI